MLVLPSNRCTPLSHQRLHSQRPARSRVLCSAYKLTANTNGAVITVEQPVFLVGSAAAADLKLQKGAEKHAELTQKGKQVFLKALVGDFVLDSTSTWIDGDEARSNVSYVLASGSSVAFGVPDNSYTISFEEPTGANPLVEMMMQGMAAGASAEVKEALSGKGSK